MENIITKNIFFILVKIFLLKKFDFKFFTNKIFVNNRNDINLYIFIFWHYK